MTIMVYISSLHTEKFLITTTKNLYHYKNVVFFNILNSISIYLKRKRTCRIKIKLINLIMSPKIYVTLTKTFFFKHNLTSLPFLLVTECHL